MTNEKAAHGETAFSFSNERILPRERTSMHVFSNLS
jgi:hypothetical protein